jgi:hypothetical protein
VNSGPIRATPGRGGIPRSALASYAWCGPGQLSATPEPGCRNRQRGIAYALIDSLGYDAAVQACLANGWNGVLATLLADRR